MPILQHVADRPREIDAELLGPLGRDLGADGEIEQPSQQAQEHVADAEASSRGLGGTGVGAAHVRFAFLFVGGGATACSRGFTNRRIREPVFLVVLRARFAYTCEI